MTVSSGESRSESPAAAPRTSVLRAWLYLVLLSWQRQARARQMVWIALGLLAVTTVSVGINTALDRWGMGHWRKPRGVGPTYQQWLNHARATYAGALPGQPPAALAQGVLG